MNTRQQQILDAARRLLQQHGLRSVTVRAVAAEAGIGASTLRYYFPSQVELYDALVRDSIRSQLQDLRIHDATRSAQERLTECLAQFLPADRAQLKGAADSWLVLLQRITEEQVDTDVLAQIRLGAVEGRQAIQRWLRVVEAEGVELAGSPHSVAELLGVLCDGLLQQLVFDPELEVEVAHRQLSDAVELMVIRGRG